jgi:hypothetical protein
MPKETFFSNTHPQVGERLSIMWSGQDKSADPLVTLTLEKQAEAPDGCTGEWGNKSNWNLERKAINGLIRSLRKARDQAYGRDE